MHASRFGCVLALILAVASTAAEAATETVQVHFLPMQEAAALVRSQLSVQGRVTTMPSRRLIVIQDDAKHIQQAKTLLKRLDVPLAQYRINLEISSRQQHQEREYGIEAFHLPGGWVRLELEDEQRTSKQAQRFQLLVSSGQPGQIEAGQIIPTPASRFWLNRHGIIETIVHQPVTSGFAVTLRPAGAKQVRINIRPWMQRETSDAENDGRIEIAEAATELIVPIGETVELAAHHADAREFGHMLLASKSSVRNSELVIRLTVEKR